MNRGQSSGFADPLLRTAREVAVDLLHNARCHGNSIRDQRLQRWRPDGVRSGDQQHSFAADLATRIENALMPRSVVLDGEIVCLDKKGCPQFNDLLFHRGTPSFVAFDLLFDGNRDLRLGRLSDRRLELRRILDRSAPPVLFADHGEQCGTALFDKACDQDVEAIVAEGKSAPYLAVTERTTWVTTGTPR